jgi:hypothetical protein
MKRKQQRELVTCPTCGLTFTRIRTFAGVIDYSFAPDDCVRCRANTDIALRTQALNAARKRWAKAIEANDRALAKCEAGKLAFVDVRGDKADG